MCQNKIGVLVEIRLASVCFVSDVEEKKISGKESGYGCGVKAIAEIPSTPFSQFCAPYRQNVKLGPHLFSFSLPDEVLTLICKKS